MPTENTFDAKQLLLIIQEECTKLGYLISIESGKDEDYWIGDAPLILPDDLTLWENIINRLIHINIVVPCIVSEPLLSEKCPYCSSNVAGLNDCHSCLAVRNRGQYRGMSEFEIKTGWIAYLTAAYLVGSEPLPQKLVEKIPLTKKQKFNTWLRSTFLGE